MTQSFSMKNTEQGIALSGALAFISASDLLKQGNELLASNSNNSVVIDCENVTRIDSAGIALLLEWKRHCDSNNKTCEIKNLPQQAISLLETYRLQSLIST